MTVELEKRKGHQVAGLSFEGIEVAIEAADRLVLDAFHGTSAVQEEADDRRVRGRLFGHSGHPRCCWGTAGRCRAKSPYL